MLTVTVNTDTKPLAALVARIADGVKPAKAAKIAAEAAADAVRENFYALSRRRHRPGQRIDYYLGAADATASSVEGGDAVVSVTHTGIAQRYFGGRIRASGRISPVTGKPVRFLAVGRRGTPGEGHTPADFAGRPGVKLGILFAFVEEVDQKPDPSVLPAPGDIQAAAAGAVAELAARLLAEPAGARFIDIPAAKEQVRQ